MGVPTRSPPPITGPEARLSHYAPRTSWALVPHPGIQRLKLAPAARSVLAPYAAVVRDQLNPYEKGQTRSRAALLFKAAVVVGRPLTEHGHLLAAQTNPCAAVAHGSQGLRLRWHSLAHPASRLAGVHGPGLRRWHCVRDVHAPWPCCHRPPSSTTDETDCVTCRRTPNGSRPRDRSRSGRGAARWATLATAAAIRPTAVCDLSSTSPSIVNASCMPTCRTCAHCSPLAKGLCGPRRASVLPVPIAGRTR